VHKDTRGVGTNPHGVTCHCTRQHCSPATSRHRHRPGPALLCSRSIFVPTCTALWARITWAANAPGDVFIAGCTTLLSHSINSCHRPGMQAPCPVGHSFHTAIMHTAAAILTLRRKEAYSVLGRLWLSEFLDICHMKVVGSALPTGRFYPPGGPYSFLSCSVNPRDIVRAKH